MSGDWGLSVRGKTSVADASPAQFIQAINFSDLPWVYGTRENTATVNFAGRVPDGTQLMALLDRPSIVTIWAGNTGASAYPVSISINGLTVSLSYPADRNPGIFPTRLWVCGIYGQPSRGDWGVWVNQGGAFPAVVDSTAGMFMTQKMTVTLTGSYPVNCSPNALVFCSCPDGGIGLNFDYSTRTLIGYRQKGGAWGYPGDFSVQVNICVFDIKTPTIPDWGLLIYGADRRVSFTSAETPLIIREQMAVPRWPGDGYAFKSPGNRPMIMPVCVGAKITNRSDIWESNLCMNGSTASIGPGKQIYHVGTNSLSDSDYVAMAGKQLPVIWGSDYF